MVKLPYALLALMFAALVLFVAALPTHETGLTPGGCGGYYLCAAPGVPAGKPDLGNLPCPWFEEVGQDGLYHVTTGGRSDCPSNVSRNAGPLIPIPKLKGAQP